MTDRPDEPQLDPATERQVSDLLRQARHTEPVPTDVAARLDAALADLVAERRPAAPVLDLDAARQRRRRLTTGLVAAAAIVVAGVSLPSLLDGSGGDMDSATSADESSADDAGGSTLAESAPSDGLAPPESGDQAPAPAAARVEVDPQRFKLDALTAREAAPTYDALTRKNRCGLPATASASVVPVQYDDRSGFLVFATPDDDRQRVDLYLCPDGELARSTVIPAP